MLPRSGLCLLALALIHAGCVVNAEQRPWPSVRRAPGPAQAPVAPDAMPPSSSRPAAPGEVLTADPEAARTFLDGLARPAQAFAVLPVPPVVTVMGLENTARSESGGAPDGDLAAATLDTGQRATMTVALPADRCTSLVGQGGLGVIELDVFLTRAGAATTILRQDVGVGPIAVVGGRGECLRSDGTMPASGELHVQVRRGRGLVLVRAYRRSL